ncbi:D-methionine transport system ATP-binding protein [Pseudobutyrivibrio sp. OR37]|uniref:methionine ABC transporter ATP-binding protein n=1 Tax=Pseudobutyrivibrio sp. OR37 TaxID=1798186 RepID=UPI0008E630B4|nr:ATP-binding cassette domain-containing protein [Pseudobutyrivibrio sp. OR37]SFI38928.1 D-methionine transport system ATP-binding protein [Pseudobutyrivibrio sp. OR37]
MNEIVVKNLSKTFAQGEQSVDALKNINLTVETGDIYGIIGMSGAGKSTLVRCFNYLEKPTSGQVLIGDKDLGQLTEKELRAERSQIAMIFQSFNLLMQKNVIDNICFPLRLQKVSKADARKRAKELLEVVGLSDKAKAYPSQLSGGQKQRVAIARALANNPRILLCDEATSALDPQTTASILELLRDINKKLGITIIVITHQMSVVSEICNKVAIIEKGQVVENGFVEDVFNHPKSSAARELILRGDDTKSGGTVETLNGERKIRIVFTENSSFEPVIANMVLKFQTPVNILRADTRNVGGVAKGEMILGLPEDSELQEDIIVYLKERGLEIEEVTGDV